MKKVAEWSEEFLNALSLTERLSLATKKADNWEWAKRKARGYDRMYGDCFDRGYVDRVTDNFLLLSGEAMRSYSKPPKELDDIDRKLALEHGVDIGNFKIKHNDTVSYLIEGFLGDQQKRDLRYGVTDSSLYTQNEIKREEGRVSLGYFQNKYVLPANERAAVEYMQKYNIKDPFDVPPEQRQQMQSEIAVRAEQLTPKDIRRYLKYGIKGSLEKRGQELADAFVVDSNLKLILDQAYYYSFASGAMIFEQGIRNAEPYLEHVVDTRKYNTWGSPSLVVDDNAGHKRVRLMYPSDILDMYGSQFTRDDFKKFSEYLVRGSSSNPRITRRDEQWVMNIPFEDLPKLNDVNMLSRDGQKEFGRMEDRYSGDESKRDLVRVVTLVWKTQKKFQYILRARPDGILHWDWHGETYTFNKANGDIDREIHWFSEFIKVVMIGEGDNAIFVDIGPYEGQYRDPTNPRKIRGPFTGAYWNDMQGMGQRRAPLDKVKNYIHKINFEFKVIEDREATDVGKVVLMTIASKPAKWSWGMYLRMMKATKFLPIDTRGAGLTPADVAFFKELDLGSLYEILPRLNLIQMWMRLMVQTLGLNEARQGNQPASTSVTNNIANMERSFSQTHNLSEWYDLIAQRLIQNGIYLYRMAAKGGNIYIRRHLSDLSLHTIDTQVNDVEDVKYFVKVFTDETDLKTLDIGKNIVQPYMQSPTGGNMRDAIRLMTAKAMSQLDDVIDEIDMDREIQAAKAAESQALSTQEMKDFQKEMLVLGEQMRQSRELLLSADKKDMAALGAMVNANANDINQDGINDFSKVAEDKLKFEEKKLAVNTGLEKEKLQILRTNGARRPPVPSK